MRKLILAGVATLALTMALPQISAAQTAAPAASASQATPEKIALVRRYMAAVHMNQMISGMMHQMMPAMMQQMRKSQPGVTDDQMANVTDAVTASMDDFMPKMTEAMVPIYAETFTTEELTRLDEFYESPIGQSILAKTPAAMQKMVPIMMQMMPDMQADMMKRMCTKIDCTAKKAAS